VPLWLNPCLLSPTAIDIDRNGNGEGGEGRGRGRGGGGKRGTPGNQIGTPSSGVTMQEHIARGEQEKGKRRDKKTSDKTRLGKT
jgi:hypothetical protein